MAKKNIKTKKPAAPLPSDHTVDDGHDHEHEGHDHDGHDHDGHDHDGHNHGGVSVSDWRIYGSAVLSFTLLIGGLALEYGLKPDWFTGWVRLVWYLIAYLPVGLPVVVQGIRAALQGSIFTEFVLMSIATVGAFAIGEYPEGVAVMLFYAIGEIFQDAAVSRAKRNIKALLDVRPDQATLLRDGNPVEVKPETVKVGDAIRVKPGERVPLDGTLAGKSDAAFDTAALTGESKPRTIYPGETVLAGMVSTERVVEINVTKPFGESSIARILKLVQNASARKAPTELFIRKFSRVYTPIVVLLAVLLVAVPALVVPDYVFRDWLYRGLIFLVISCPCALVISIPLGYFGGIGAASRQGILFKGSNFLDLMTRVSIVVMDKTGTLTYGVFKVQKVESVGVEKNDLLVTAAALEQHSTHPVAKALLQYAEEHKLDWKKTTVDEVKEIAGHGLTGKVNGKQVIVGNMKLLDKFKVSYPAELNDETDTIALVAIGGKYAGFVTIADEIKPDAADTIKRLHEVGIRELVMLSGDKDTVVKKVIGALGIGQGFGDLLPEDKVKKVQDLKRSNPGSVIAFMGDGLNDAPVLATADVGIAMGGLGSDAAIETADVVIQTDEPSKVATAIAIGRMTRRVVWQNIGFAFGVKLIVLAMGAGGLATMWEAVFADVGVALLAILNAVRIQRMKF
jgi:Cd2+/Zn2+-exporting ATPase